MSLDISPEILPAISAQITAAQSSLTSMISAAAGPAVPVPAAVDSVSTLASAVLATYQTSFFGATAPGIAHLLAGAEVLIPVGTDYATSDIAGGGYVGMSGAVMPA